MYAIIETGGKQYRVSVGDILDVELLGEESQVQFKKVLLLNDGTKVHLNQGVVHAERIGDAKGPKVIAYKYKKTENYRRTVGHRQKYTRVKIVSITAA